MEVTIFVQVQVAEANVSGVPVAEANLLGAQMNGANLTGADLETLYVNPVPRAPTIMSVG